jgi:hypothetical protein
MAFVESSIANAAIQALEWHKCGVYRIQTGQWNTEQGYFMHGAIAGTSDYIVSIPKDGYHLIGFMEVKTPTGRVSDSQIAFLREINKKHIPWIVLDDPKQIDDWMNDIFNYHGNLAKIKNIIDESKKFVRQWDGRRHRKTEKMSWEVMAQIDKFSK